METAVVAELRCSNSPPAELGNLITTLSCILRMRPARFTGPNLQNQLVAEAITQLFRHGNPRVGMMYIQSKAILYW